MESPPATSEPEDPSVMLFFRAETAAPVENHAVDRHLTWTPSYTAAATVLLRPLMLLDSPALRCGELQMQHPVVLPARCKLGLPPAAHLLLARRRGCGFMRAKQ